MTARTKVGWLLLGAILVAVLLALLAMPKDGFSARGEPSAAEAFLARWMRHKAMPRAAHAMDNPVPLTPEALAEARAHFADHCATCHGNDGKGQTQIGQGLYPKVPDMQLESTQSLSDGEIFYIIHNGIRLTGMPAWGPEPPAEDLGSWQLVHFIRHLPDITPEEIAEMESMNPMSRREFEKEQEIERFLEGGEPAPAPPEHKH